MKKNKYLELEKLKFHYQYLNDTEKHNFFVYAVIMGTGTITFIKGEGIFSVIGALLFLIGIVFIISKVKEAQKEMPKIFKKIQNLR